MGFFFSKTESADFPKIYKKKWHNWEKVNHGANEGRMATQWIVLLSHRKKDLGSRQGRAFLCGVCMFSLPLYGFSLGTPASYHSPKTWKKLVSMDTLKIVHRCNWLFVLFQVVPCRRLMSAGIGSRSTRVPEKDKRFQIIDGCKWSMENVHLKKKKTPIISTEYI